jgi:hypothetical protein
MNLKRIRLFIVVNTIAFIAMVVVNYLANALPINGYNTGEVSALYSNYFVPAGFTFSIWGIIYLFLGLFIVRALYLYKNDRSIDLSLISAISFWFFLSCVANALWIFCWHYLQIFYTVILMLILLYSLMKIYLITRQIRVKGLDYYSLSVPFSIYLAWISVATIANFTAYLTDSSWQGLGINPEIWSVIMILVACSIGIMMLIGFADVSFTLVLIWAFFGLYMKASDTTNAFSSQIAANTALLSIIVSVSAIVFLIYRKQMKI